MHDSNGAAFDYLNPVLKSSSQELSLAHDASLHGLTSPVGGTTTGWVHLNVDTTQLANNGRNEIRLRAYANTPDGNVMHTSMNMMIFYVNGKPVSNMGRFPFERGKGWYTGSGYCEGDIVTDLPQSVSGIWSPTLRIVDHAEAGDIPVTHHFVSLDPDFHATPVVLGSIIADGSGPFPQQAVSIDTRSLTNGKHKLLLRADCDDPRGSTNSGVLVFTFVVGN